MNKKSVLLSILFCFFVSLTFNSYGEETQKNAINKPIIGDINEDGEVNSTDLALLKRYILGIFDASGMDNFMWTADVNGDNLADSTDSAYIRRYCLAIITQFPKGKSGQIEISCGNTHTLALKDGSVWSFGDNRSGQLGLGEEISKSISPSLVKGLPSIKKVLAGREHSIALGEDGSIWGWGNNTYNQLIDPQGEIKQVSTRIIGFKPLTIAPQEEIKDIYLGYNYTLGVYESKTILYCLAVIEGSKFVYIPQVIKNLTDVKSAALGKGHIVILKSDGTVYTWGENFYGQLGDGSIQYHTFNNYEKEPVNAKYLSDIVEVGAGSSHSVALRKDGTVWSWGSNFSGEQGDNTTTSVLEPKKVAGLENIISIGVGESYTVALKSDGTVWAWGKNNFGQLGNNSTANSRVPLQIEGLSDIEAINVGINHSVAYKKDGTVWAWGDNRYGQLGNGNSDEILTPVKMDVEALK